MFQISVKLAPAQQKRLDAVVKERQKVDAFCKRADVMRELLELGLRTLEAKKPRARAHV